MNTNYKVFAGLCLGFCVIFFELAVRYYKAWRNKREITRARLETEARTLFDDAIGVLLDSDYLLDHAPMSRTAYNRMTIRVTGTLVSYELESRTVGEHVYVSLYVRQSGILMSEPLSSYGKDNLGQLVPDLEGRVRFVLSVPTAYHA